MNIIRLVLLSVAILSVLMMMVTFLYEELVKNKTKNETKIG
jgi:hypothetical protein